MVTLIRRKLRTLQKYTSIFDVHSELQEVATLIDTYKKTDTPIPEDLSIRTKELQRRLTPITPLLDGFKQGGMRKKLLKLFEEVSKLIFDIQKLEMEIKSEVNLATQH